MKVTKTIVYSHTIPIDSEIVKDFKNDKFEFIRIKKDNQLNNNKKLYNEGVEKTINRMLPNSKFKTIEYSDNLELMEKLFSLNVKKLYIQNDDPLVTLTVLDFLDIDINFYEEIDTVINRKVDLNKVRSLIANEDEEEDHNKLLPFRQKNIFDRVSLLEFVKDKNFKLNEISFINKYVGTKSVKREEQKNQISKGVLNLSFIKNCNSLYSYKSIPKQGKGEISKNKLLLGLKNKKELLPADLSALWSLLKLGLVSVEELLVIAHENLGTDQEYLKLFELISQFDYYRRLICENNVIYTNFDYTSLNLLNEASFKNIEKYFDKEKEHLLSKKDLLAGKTGSTLMDELIFHLRTTGELPVQAISFFMNYIVLHSSTFREAYYHVKELYEFYGSQGFTPYEAVTFMESLKIPEHYIKRTCIGKLPIAREDFVFFDLKQNNWNVTISNIK